MSGMRERIAWALAGVLGLLVVAALAGVIEGGDLDPAAPPGSTMKSLDEVEPRTAISSLPFAITQPGSYYLTGDLLGASGQNGITVDADDVTIDLNGFTLRGEFGSLDGIRVNNVHYGLVIRDGVIRGWGGDGIDASDPASPNIRGAFSARIEGIDIRSSGEDGVRVGGDSSIRDCIAQSNGDDGVIILGSGLVEDCEAVGNGSVGVGVTGEAIVRGALAENNPGTGISIGSWSLVEASVSDANGIGIAGGTDVRIVASMALGNSSQGILVGNDSQVVDSVANANGAAGISAEVGALVEGSTATDNQVGISVVSGVVRGNVLRNNTGDGIVAESNAHILDNETTGNGSGGDGAGIHVMADGNRIEGNTAISNDRGFDVDAAGNVVIRNTARANTDNYGAVVANNVMGPIVTSANVVTSGNPHANYAP